MNIETLRHESNKKIERFMTEKRQIILPVVFVVWDHSTIT